MTRALKEGETRTFRKLQGSSIKISAQCADSDTPIINIELDGESYELTDTEAYYIAATLRKALSILPTSK